MLSIQLFTCVYEIEIINLGKGWGSAFKSFFSPYKQFSVNTALRFVVITTVNNSSIRTLVLIHINVWLKRKPADAFYLNEPSVTLSIWRL